MERERGVVTGLLLLQLVLWLGFAVHRSPRFAGSLAGGVLAVSAAVLMLVPLAYPLVKRVGWLRERVVAGLPLPRLLAWHVYASIVGSVLAVLHTGHRFQSTLGILLAASMLIAVLTGYIGRHFLHYLSRELKERQESLRMLRAEYDDVAAKIAVLPQGVPTLTLAATVRERLAAVIAGTRPLNGSSELRSLALVLSEAIADTEYAIAANDLIKRRLRIWIYAHIAASVAFYLLLALHIGAGIGYGLRWFS